MTADEFKDQWRAQKEPWHRLRWARTYWQMRANSVGGTATDAADSMGMKPGTYRQYERPAGSSRTTPMGHQEAIRFGRKFGVSWAWLLLGEGTPFDDQLPAVQQRVLHAMEQANEEQQAALALMVEAFLQRKAG